jgi:heat shock protein HspQ
MVKRKNIYRFIIWITAFVIPLTTVFYPCSAQQNNFFHPCENRVTDEKIRTVLLYKENAAMTLPMINLNSGEKLELHFDDLSGEQKRFAYTLIHCDAQWEPSPLEPQEYLDGYGSGTIEKVNASFNTTRDYFHYSLVFPSEDANPRISGNYVIVVYQNNDPENVVLIRQFYVAEPLVTLEAEIRQPADDKYYTGQEIEFRILYKDYPIADPAGDIKVLIRQNRNPESERSITKPRFIGPESLDYGGNNSIVFDGGNEFRYFDIKSMKYAAEHIDRIDFQSPWYHVFLKPDEPRTYDPYFTQQELNGDFYTETENSQNRHIDADYVYVHFQMPAQLPYTDADIFIFGALSGWSAGDDFRMHYNADRHVYENAMLLKQGFYNYQYAYRQNGSALMNTGYFEGHHFETENEYTFLVYHSDPAWDYDRLIAVLQIHSGSK